MWLLLTLCVWLAVIYLSGQRSPHPEVLGRYSWRYFTFFSLICAFAAIMTATHWERLLRAIYSNRKSLLLSLATFIVMLGLMELFVRMADPWGISYYQKAAEARLEFILPDPDLVYRLKPNFRTAGGSSFNEFGLRDGPILPKSREEYRILALGDSVTYGSGVPQDEIFTVKVQRLLGARLERPVRVINAGVIGYNTVQELAFLRKTGLSFDPDLIILMYVANDTEINRGPVDPESRRSFKNKSPGQILRRLAGYSWLYRLTYHSFRYSRFSRRKAYDSMRETEGWRASMESLKAIAEICRGRGIPLATFFWRWAVDSSVLIEDVREYVAPFHVEDVGPWFMDKPTKRYTISKVDSHPNAEAHQVIAENIAAYLWELYAVQTDKKKS